MMLVEDIIKSFREILSSDYEQEELDQILVSSFEHACSFSRADLILSASEELSSVESDELLRIQGGLKRGSPIQHVLGYSWFMDDKYMVSPDVLIPRPETEELVRWVREDHASDNGSHLNVLDICTGSGCIAISLSKFYPSWNIKALDISEPALKIADQNRKILNSDIKLFQADILNWKRDQHIIKELTNLDSAKDGLDIVISNPPYVPLKQSASLNARVRDHEPSLALFVPDEDPSIFYREIADFSSTHLKTGARLYFEIHRDLGEEIVKMLKEFKFSDIIIRKDINGNDRMISATFKS